MSFSTSVLAAITRLLSYYNGSVYNVSSNPGGMAGGGHATNFIPALQDLSAVATATATEAANANTSSGNAAASATAAAASATSAAGSATAAAALAAGLTDTSATSLAIGAGAKTFTCSAGKQFAAGQFVLVTSSANSANYMHGQVTSYTGTTLVINVLDIGGSGTHADWALSVSGSQGAAGAPGYGLPTFTGADQNRMICIVNTVAVTRSRLDIADAIAMNS